MRQVDAYSVSKRRSIVSESHKDISPSTRRCSLLFENAKRSNRNSDIIELIKECSDNKANCKIYARSIAEMVSDNKDMTAQFLESIKSYDNPILNDILTSKNISEVIKEAVRDQIEFNETCDTIYNNDYNIRKDYDISEFVTNMAVPNVDIIVSKICEVVDTFNIPVYGKFQSAVSEAYYIFSKFGLDFKEKELIDYVAEYFLLSNGPYKDDLQLRAIGVSLENTYLRNIISEGLFDKPESGPSMVEGICKEFSEKGDTSVAALDAFHHEIMKCPVDEVVEDFNKYLNTLLRILLMPEEDEASSHIIRNIITKIYMDTNSRNRDDLKTLMVRLNWHITKVDNYINDYQPEEKVLERLTKYRSALQDTRELLDADLDSMYSNYNESCIESSVETEPITLNEYKIFKFDNLITRTYKLDKYIQNKVEPSRQKIFKYVKDKNQEIFGESDSIYDFLTPDGGIDYCVRSYAYDESSVNFNEVNDFLTKIIMEANESILNGTDLTCYYELTTDLVEFHIKESVNISLDEDERTFVENYLSREDEDRMLTIYSAGILLANENFDYCKDVVNYFVNKEMTVQEMTSKFKELLEASSAIGISKDIIQECYNSIIYNTSGYSRDMFRYYASSMVENYTPNNGNDILTILESYNYTQYLLELVHDPYTAVNTKNLSKYGYNGEDEHKRNRDDDDEDERPVKKSQPQPAPVSHREEPEEEADDDYQDVQKNGPMANMTPTNMKLAGKAIGQKAANNKARVDRAFRMSDVIFNHFVKACKDALVSDRREAIIKGSVIPSFSKCIKISIALAALGAATGGIAVPVLTAIGGLIASKKLTQRERSLLLDDIEVEIQVIDKELQIADANNQINKYRALMKMKKDLQRQYQRIKMNIRMGKDIVPSKTSIDSEV